MRMVAMVLGGGLVLAGCASTQSPSADTTPAPTGAASASSNATGAITVRDPWMKAADSGMTAAFGTLVNSSDKELTVVSATSAVAKMMELHEVAMVDGKMQMRPKAGGFMIPAGGTHELAPGADHIMIMGLTKPVQPGDEVTVTLTLSDGSTVQFTAVGKAFAGGNESYAPNHNG